MWEMFWDLIQTALVLGVVGVILNVSSNGEGHIGRLGNFLFWVVLLLVVVAFLQLIWN